MGDCEIGFWTAFWLLGIIGWIFIGACFIIGIVNFINTKGWEYWIDILLHDPIETLIGLSFASFSAIFFYWFFKNYKIFSY